MRQVNADGRGHTWLHAECRAQWHQEPAGKGAGGTIGDGHCFRRGCEMTFTTHCTYNIDSDGQVELREGQLPAVIKRSPVSVTVVDGTDLCLACKLLRQLADEMEVGRQDIGHASVNVR